MDLDPSRRVLDLLRVENAIRERAQRPDRDHLARLLEAQGLPPHEAICAFEDRFGGWVGSWIVVGVMATPARTSARLPGHALIGRRGPDDFFMAPDGRVVTVEDGAAITVSGNAEAWLEQLALRRAIEMKQNAMYLHLQGAPVAELARDLGAKRDPVASDRVDSFVLPKGQGLLLGPYGDEASTLALVPSVRGAARLLSPKVKGVSVAPIRPRDERLPHEDAPPRATVLARASFEPLRRGRCVHVVALSQQGEDPVLEQWSLTDADRARAHWFLRDGGFRLEIFLGGPSSGPPGAQSKPLSGVELAFDPLLRCDGDQQLSALLFERGFPSFPAALAFDERFGGLSFWTDQFVILGIASELRRHPSLLAGEVRGGVPIGLAEGRRWRLLPTGVVETIGEDDGSPQRSHPTVDAFIGSLAQRARPWKLFVYAVEA